MTPPATVPESAPKHAAPAPLPTWLVLLSSALITHAGLQVLDRARQGRDEAARTRAALLPALGDPPRARIDPLQASARELRRLPGIGRRRAEAIVRARRGADGADFTLSDVPGIGPRTAARVETWLFDAMEDEPQHDSARK